jgi:uncharacterized membrane protein YphA (DoxX/SURF4 family)
VRLDSKPVRITVTVLSVLLALMFVGASIPKLLGAPDAVAGFAKYGYPDWLRLAVGVTEVVAAALLLVPRLAWIGASAIAVIMIGATYTHAVLGTGEGGNAVVTLVLLVIASFIAYARWPRAHASAGGVAHGTAPVR